ncbi:MAG: peptide/nickel transport system permease protein [Thermoleophilaceae bacterium]|jgi:peptide/nickel transport system permease protein|nr:peptide/nickel transport system permease protein [Thermoleophilaceae bacterium]MEA2438166.1 peptide/nickel transport system permease protein [Thermoleophilaceae bacterium]
MVAVLLVVSIATFAAFDLLPQGDPAERLAGRQPSSEQVRAIRHEWGFDQGVGTQYLTMMRKAFAGRLVSYQTGLEVHGEIWRRLPRTLWLAFGGIVLAAAVGVGLALLTAGRRRRRSGAVAEGVALVGISTPVFWLGAVLAYLIGFKAGVLPNGGYVPFADDPLEWLRHLILPWITVAIVATGTYLLVARARIEQALSEEYTRAALAAGIGPRALARRALRPALAPLVALWGLDFAGVAAGSAVLVEAVFDLGGVGQYAADAMADLDAPAVIGVTLLAAFFIVIVNAAVDVAQVALDPRRRAGR